MVIVYRRAVLFVSSYAALDVKKSKNVSIYGGFYPGYYSLLSDNQNDNME